MGLRLFFFTNFPGAMFIQGATFIPDSRVGKLPIILSNIHHTLESWNKRSPLNKHSLWKFDKKNKHSPLKCANYVVKFKSFKCLEKIPKIFCISGGPPVQLSSFLCNHPITFEFSASRKKQAQTLFDGIFTNSIFHLMFY